jgi:hypothetical protein
LFDAHCFKQKVDGMRWKRVLFAALLLTCLLIPAYAVEAGVIAEPSISGANMNMPTPKITSPTMSVPEAKQNQLTNSSDNSNRNADQALKETGELSVSQTQKNPVSQVNRLTDVSGRWSVRFDDRTDMSLDLTLWSSGKDSIMGYGTMMKGGAARSVTATGSLDGREMALTAKSAASEYTSQDYDECVFDLSMENSTLLGTYSLKSGGQSSSEGNATATKVG